MTGMYLTNACADCQAVEASLSIRNRWLCRDCFIKYVRSKVLKRMESYRVKNDSPEQQRKLLLPVSGGTSSLVLLEILDAQYQKQLASRGRSAYGLHVFLIDTSHVDSSSHGAGLLDSIKDRFPSHECSVLPLEAIFDLDSSILDALSKMGCDMLAVLNPESALKRVLTSATTLTSRSDLLEILLLRLIVAFAKVENCESVLWGHSDSRLAAKALSNVSKGRGSSLPFDIGDGPSPWGLHFKYPQRDLFKSELELYASLLTGKLSDVVKPDIQPETPPSIRNTSIDDLLTSYINSQGEKYPSIMANVVRTASKLRAPLPPDQAAACLLCATPLASPKGERSEAVLCYGCLKIGLEIHVRAVKSGS